MTESTLVRACPGLSRNVRTDTQDGAGRVSTPRVSGVGGYRGGTDMDNHLRNLGVTPVRGFPPAPRTTTKTTRETSREKGTQP